jgi:hypothetical protein
VANQYQQFINWAGSQYGADGGVLNNIARLESGYRPHVTNNWDSNAAAGHPSTGMFQYVPATFRSYAQQAKAANPGAWRGLGGFNINNWKQQALATAWAVKNGHGSAWATYDRALKGGGGGGTSFTLPGQGRWVGGPDQKKVARIESLWGDDPTLAGLKAQKYMDANQAKWVEGPSTTVRIPGGGAPVRGGYQNRFHTLANNFGLQWDSNAPWYQNPQQGGGTHADGSYHYTGHASDWGLAKNSMAQLMQVARWARQHRGQISELFFNPLGWGIKNGRVVKGLTAAGHDDHLHLAFR